MAVKKNTINEDCDHDYFQNYTSPEKHTRQEVGQLCTGTKLNVFTDAAE